MKKVKNLYGVKATVLPAKVMVLLSKYSQAVKEYEGAVIQLSSLNVFKHVHNSYSRSKHPAVRKCYKYLLREVNYHLEEGNMAVSSEIASSPMQQSSQELDERYRSPNFWKKSPHNHDYSVTVGRSH